MPWDFSMYDRQIQADQNDRRIASQEKVADAQVAKYQQDTEYENVKQLGQNALMRALMGEQLSPKEWAAAQIADAQSGGMTYNPVTGAMETKPSLFQKLNIPPQGAQGFNAGVLAMPQLPPSGIPKNRPQQGGWNAAPQGGGQDPLAQVQRYADQGGYLKPPAAPQGDFGAGNGMLTMPPLMPPQGATVQGGEPTDNDMFRDAARVYQHGSNLDGVYNTTRNAAQGNPKLQQEIDAEKAKIDLKNAAIPYSSDVQALSAGFADRMKTAQDILSTQDIQGTNALKNTLNKLPLGGYAVGEDYQSYDQAKRDFINAQLRRESGATIQDEEFQSAERQYFPQPGDSGAIIQQKARARHQAVINMQRTAGPNYSEQRPPAQPKQRKAPPAVGTEKNGYIFMGGDPANPKSWSKP